MEFRRPTQLHTTRRGIGSVNASVEHCMFCSIPSHPNRNISGLCTWHMWFLPIIPCAIILLVSPHFLIFGHTPWLPVDFLFAGVENLVMGSVGDWVARHQDGLRVTYGRVKAQVEAAIEKCCMIRL